MQRLASWVGATLGGLAFRLLVHLRHLTRCLISAPRACTVRLPTTATEQTQATHFSMDALQQGWVSPPSLKSQQMERVVALAPRPWR